MKGYLLDFGLVENPQKYSGISDQAFRTLGENEMILQMFFRRHHQSALDMMILKHPTSKKVLNTIDPKALK